MKEQSTAPIVKTTNGYTRKRAYRTVQTHYDWQKLPCMGTTTLKIKQAFLRNEVCEKLAQKAPGLHVIVVAPGIGKSTAAATIKSEFNVAWLAQRHDMVDNVPALQRLRHIQPPGPENCPEWKLVNELAAKGYDAAGLHSPGCPYMEQFTPKGSSVYMQEYRMTPYILAHGDGIIMDELTLEDWLPEEKIRPVDLWKGLPDGIAKDLFRGLVDLALEAGDLTQKYNQESRNRIHVFHGKDVFDGLNDKLHGNLASVLLDLKRSGECQEDRPAYGGEFDNWLVRDAPIAKHGMVIKAFLAEMDRWLSGDEFNSLLAVDGDYIRVTKRLSLPQTKKPIILLDATAREDMTALLFPEIPVQFYRLGFVRTSPPPHMRHIWLQGDRFTKGSLTATGDYGNENRSYVARAVKYILRREGISYSNLGLVTFKDCEGLPNARTGEEPTGMLRQKLNTHQSLHFFGLRGSNHLQDCDVLVVAGTPRKPGDEVLRIAQALYWHDSKPVVASDDDYRYRAVRDYLIVSELTQAAHRSRALRNDYRTVITLSEYEPEFLPVTDRVMQLPPLLDDGTDRYEARDVIAEAKCVAAVQTILARGEKVTYRGIAREAGVRNTVALAFMRKWKLEQS